MIRARLIDRPVLSEIVSMNPSRGPAPIPAATYIPPPIPVMAIPENKMSKFIHK